VEVAHLCPAGESALLVMLYRVLAGARVLRASGSFARKPWSQVDDLPCMVGLLCLMRFLSSSLQHLTGFCAHLLARRISWCIVVLSMQPQVKLACCNFAELQLLVVDTFAVTLSCQVAK